MYKQSYTIRCQFNSKFGAFAGIQFSDRPFAVRESNILFENCRTLYWGLSYLWLAPIQFWTDLYCIIPPVSENTLQGLPMQIGIKTSFCCSPLSGCGSAGAGAGTGTPKIIIGEEV